MTLNPTMNAAHPVIAITVVAMLIALIPGEAVLPLLTNRDSWDLYPLMQCRPALTM